MLELFLRPIATQQSGWHLFLSHSGKRRAFKQNKACSCNAALILRRSVVGILLLHPLSSRLHKRGISISVEESVPRNARGLLFSRSFFRQTTSAQIRIPPHEQVCSCHKSLSGRQRRSFLDRC